MDAPTGPASPPLPMRRSFPLWLAEHRRRSRCPARRGARRTRAPAQSGHGRPVCAALLRREAQGTPPRSGGATQSGPVSFRSFSCRADKTKEPGRARARTECSEGSETLPDNVMPPMAQLEYRLRRLHRLPNVAHLTEYNHEQGPARRTRTPTAAAVHSFPGAGGATDRAAPGPRHATREVTARRSRRPIPADSGWGAWRHQCPGIRGGRPVVPVVGRGRVVRVPGSGSVRGWPRSRPGWRGPGGRRCCADSPRAARAWSRR